MIVLTCLTLITLDSRNGRSGALGTLGGLAHRVVSPFQGAVNDVARPVGDWWDGVTNSGDLKQKNRQLEEQIAALRGQQSAAAEAIRENNDLKASLRLQSLLNVKSVTASVVGSGEGNFDPTLTIDKGSETGIALDMPVISPAGIVGKVIEVGHGYAKIQVLTDPDFTVGVQTPGHVGSPPATGGATGQGARDLKLELDAGTKVRVGDRIVTSALSTLFPAGLPVGVVTTVTVQPGNTGVEAMVQPYVDIGALQHVTVLLWAPGTPGPVLPTTTTTTTTATTTTTTTTVPGQTTTSTGP